MNKILVFLFLVFALRLFAQPQIEPTDQFIIEGLVKTKMSVTLPMLSTFKIHNIDSVIITNHLLQKKQTLKNLKGVLLKDVLEKSQIEAANHHMVNEYYIVCVASDNYKVVFSWNELFNSKTGESVYLLTEFNDMPVALSKDRMILISTNDVATGRRYVKGLQKIIVERVK